jgi:hypothetical protein
MTTQSLEEARITDDEESMSADGISPQFIRQPEICECLRIRQLRGRYKEYNRIPDKEMPFPKDTHNLRFCTLVLNKQLSDPISIYKKDIFDH